jgi:trehalose synthase-fused probable maltokinase
VGVPTVAAPPPNAAGAARASIRPWTLLSVSGGRERIARDLLAYAQQRRWFRAKTRKTQGARIVDVLPLDRAAPESAEELLAILEITYGDGGEADLYAIPLACVDQGEGIALGFERPSALIGAESGSAGATGPPESQALVDGLVSGSAAGPLLQVLRASETRRGEVGELRGEASPLLAELLQDGVPQVEVSRVEQTNSTLVFGHRAILKIYRHLTTGPNPELEVGRFLTEACHPPCVPRVLGALSYLPRNGGPALSLGIAHEFLTNAGDAWSLAQRALRSYFARVSGAPPAKRPIAGGSALLAAARATPVPDAGASTGGVGRFIAHAETLGRRTAEMHLALVSGAADGAENPDFAPEPLTPADRGVLVARAGQMLEQTFAALAEAVQRGLGTEAQLIAERLLASGAKRQTLELLAAFRDRPLTALKTRTHGDFHLGQVLARRPEAAADDEIADFVIVDFEGEPARSLAERRTKSSPLRDVMGMIRSFDYAPAAALKGSDPQSPGGWRNQPGTEPDIRALIGWGHYWTREVTVAYLRSYLNAAGQAPFIPKAFEELALLVTFHELEKVIYEVGYELNNRPGWVEIPLRGLAAILNGGSAPTTPVGERETKEIE